MVLVGDLGILTFPSLLFPCLPNPDYNILETPPLNYNDPCRQESLVFIYLYLIFNNARPLIDI